MTVKHNVLIVDDHRITQNGLRFLFASLDRFSVIDALDRGTTVNAFVQSKPVDLVILDLNLPDVRSINVLAEIVGSRDMTVIILTGETQLNEIHSALKLGARRGQQIRPARSYRGRLRCRACRRNLYFSAHRRSAW